MNLFLVFFLALFLAPLSAFAQSDLREAGSEMRFRVIERFPDRDRGPALKSTIGPQSPFYSAVEEARKENWSTAHRMLSADELATPLQETPAARFLAGYVALQTSRFDIALGLFEGLEDELPLLADYIALYGAQAAMQSNDPHRAILLAARVPADSRLYPDALLLLARGLTESAEAADKTRAAEVLELYLERFSSRNDGPRARLLLGQTLEELRRPADAARAYLALRDEHPLRNEARQADERLTALSASLDAPLRARITESSPQRTLRRFQGLYNQHQSDTVVSELPDQLQQFNRGSQEYCEATFMVAHSYTKLRRHSDATPWYDRVLRHCRRTSFEIRALYLGGRGRWNAGDRAGAMEIFERIWTEYPEHSFSDDAMFFTARILRSEERHDEAETLLRRQVELYPDGDMAKDAHWLLVRRMFDTEDYDAIVRYVDSLTETGEDDLYSRGRLHYFRARALELSERNTEAAEGFVRVARDYPKSYYALLSFNRLARLQGASDNDGVDVCATAGPVCEELLRPSRETQSVPIPLSLHRDNDYRRGLQLLDLGLAELARAEFNALRQRHARSPETLWALASLLDLAGSYPLSHDIARRHIDGWMNAYPTTETRALWTIAYPTPFKDEVNRYARQRNVDAALIYAIMREESGFNPRVESWANARGLLQLIDGTAQRMAESVGLQPYSFDMLFDPSVNVRLGSAYMDDLGQRADNHPALIMAGYNAGFGVVSRWLEESGHLPLDLFVEDIPFGQTRNYTKRVLMSYWIYTFLYGDTRVPALSFTLPVE